MKDLIFDHRVFLNVCNEIKLLSKCQFTQVACIMVNEYGRIIATGVNGTIPGQTNCCDLHFETRDDHAVFSDRHEIHAEMNAIEELAKSGIRPDKLTVYTNISPCWNCLKHLLGLTRKKGNNKIEIDMIVYEEAYHRLTKEDISDMKKNALNCGSILTSYQDLTILADRLQSQKGK